MVTFTFFMFRHCRGRERWCGIFRNDPWVKPGRWGFWLPGIEVGSRNPGNRFGCWLKRVGLWPW